MPRRRRHRRSSRRAGGVPGASGPRIPFATSEDPVDNACDRWELQATGVEIPTLIVYGQEIEPTSAPTSVTEMTATALVAGTTVPRN